jgi:hypothetical protein
VFGCRLCLFKLCDSDFGIIPVAELTTGTTIIIIIIIVVVVVVVVVVV